MTVTAAEHALSVRQILALERIAAGDPEVVAGAGHLDRPVRWVHVAEVADVGVMLSGGEMVLTTGVLLAGNAHARTEYIESLHRAEAAAVVLGLGRAFRHRPRTCGARPSGTGCRWSSCTARSPSPNSRRRSSRGS